MGTPTKSDGPALLAIAILHLVAQVAHGYSHVAASVPLTAFQQLFIVAVVTVAPFAGVYAYRKLDRRRGWRCLSSSASPSAPTWSRAEQVEPPGSSLPCTRQEGLGQALRSYRIQPRVPQNRAPLRNVAPSRTRTNPIRSAWSAPRRGPDRA